MFYSNCVLFQLTFRSLSLCPCSCLICLQLRAERKMFVVSSRQPPPTTSRLPAPAFGLPPPLAVPFSPRAAERVCTAERPSVERAQWEFLVAGEACIVRRIFRRECARLFGRREGWNLYVHLPSSWSNFRLSPLCPLGSKSGRYAGACLVL